ncbi:V-set domain-containing T-cell activation inhibitor 1-like isoform X1 [Carassius gibelio]|uniref:V-set domain-containing T-cell activation inhibitor 1-like isoform X1 n=1 Tax=Carassius gibelio TaxID=101364 RepID=UPI002279480D|nr:V-set domain-containing T-cell activation inhibitor 1-like isoform X1 [Carassius gibelio]
MFVRCCVIHVLFLNLIDKGSPGSPECQDVTGFVGDSVLMPCSYQDRKLEPEEINVFWRYNAYKIVYDIEQGKPSTIEQDPMFKGRITSFLQEHKNGNFSLILSNLTVTDAGQFLCDIPDVEKKCERMLHVKAHPTTTSTATSDTRSSSMKTQPEGIATFLTVVLEFLILHYICLLY